MIVLEVKIYANRQILIPNCGVLDRSVSTLPYLTLEMENESCWHSKFVLLLGFDILISIQHQDIGNSYIKMSFCLSFFMASLSRAMTLSTNMQRWAGLLTVLLISEKCPYTCQGKQVCDTVGKPARVSRFMDSFAYNRKVSINLPGLAGLWH